MNTESHRKSVAKYDKENSKFVGLKFNRKTDADIIKKLEELKAAGISTQTYIKNLIRYAIEFMSDYKL